MKKILVLLFLFSSIGSAFAYTNEPVPFETGASRNLCDVRSQEDYLNNQTPISMTLRQRIDLFNQEINSAGTQATGTGQCIYGIYFLDPMSIRLQEPLRIRAIQHRLNDGQTTAGTYISGRRQTPLSNGDNTLPVVIDAVQITQTSGQCAFMIENGLTSFQQIHDITILVSQTNRAICDGQGRDLMDQVIPNQSRNCPAGTLARNCDFQNVRVISPAPTTPPPPDDTDTDGDFVPDRLDQCDETPPVTGRNIDSRGCYIDSTLPPTDTDGDLIPDSLDQCANTPPATGRTLDNRGCYVDTTNPTDPTHNLLPTIPSCEISSELTTDHVLLHWTTSGTLNDSNPFELRRNNQSIQTISIRDRDYSENLPSEARTVYQLVVRGPSGQSTCSTAVLRQFAPSNPQPQQNSPISCSINYSATAQNITLTWSIQSTAQGTQNISLTKNGTATTLSSAQGTTYTEAIPTTSSTYVLNVQQGTSQTNCSTTYIPAPVNPDTSGNVRDTDGDGVTDATDNCPQVANHDQADEDENDIGNVCDPDFSDNTPPARSSATCSLAVDQKSDQTSMKWILISMISSITLLFFMRVNNFRNKI